MKRIAEYFAIACVLIGPSAHAQVPFHLTPSWTSTDVSNLSTGAAWADINRDGWLDLVIANGNDIARQRVVVYLNNGDGTLPSTPCWQSSDIDYHGHLAIGDVNNDGYPDVAVSVFLGAARTDQKGKVKLYLNSHGTLSTTPSWVSRDSLYTFSCAFGDADGDGDLDLAVAGGEDSKHREQDRIYYNHGGQLDSVPSWKSRDAGCSLDVTWADFDNDGRLDLAFANEGTPNRIYKNYGDSIGTVPVWSSTDPTKRANSLFVGDVNDDGYLDLAISDNNPFGGTGSFKLYLNNAGTLSTTPFWASSWSGYGSGIALADIDNDGDRDLITGGWWQPCRIYVNQGGAFTATPQWMSNTNSVVEAIVFGDHDNDGLGTLNVRFTGNGTTKLFYLQGSPLQRPPIVLIGVDTLALGEYCFDLENGWISLNVAPTKGVIVFVQAVVSHDLDFAVSNWDQTIGNYVFLNTSPPVAVPEGACLPDEVSLSQNYPNPVRLTTSIRFQIPKSTPRFDDRSTGYVSLRVYDALGREVATLVNEARQPGEYQVSFDASALSSGVYFYRLRRGDCVATKRLLILK